jgi:hypothetical protein
MKVETKFAWKLSTVFLAENNKQVSTVTQCMPQIP